jgi:hypothetical protein
MAAVTLYASANSGGLLCQHATYATARSGAGSLSVTPANDARIGQRFAFSTYFCWEYGLEFDLSSLAGATITDATLSLYLLADDSATDFTIEVRKFDYGAAYTTADFVAGASISSSTLVAQLSTLGIGSDGVYKALTDVAMVGNLTVGTTNRFLIASSRQKDGTTPTAAEYITAYYDNNGGDAVRPKLDITYVTATAAGHSSGTGAAQAPRVRLGLGEKVEVSDAFGVAYAATASGVSGGGAVKDVPAGHATAEGWASQGLGSDLDVAAPAIAITAVSYGPGRMTNAELVTVTAEAPDAEYVVGVVAGLPSPNGFGVAHDATISTDASVSVTAELVEATGAAYDPIAGADASTSAEVASVTGEAYAISSSIRPAAPAATVTGASYGALQTYATSAIATSTGEAYGTDAAVAASAGTTAATGTAQGASIAVATRAGAATVSGTAPAVSIAIAMQPGHAAAIAAAYGLTTDIETNAEHASATGEAYGLTQATVDVSAGTTAATGEAYGARPRVGAKATTARATPTAYQPVMAGPPVSEVTIVADTPMEVVLVATSDIEVLMR